MPSRRQKGHGSETERLERALTISFALAQAREVAELSDSHWTWIMSSWNDNNGQEALSNDDNPINSVCESAIAAFQALIDAIKREPGIHALPNSSRKSTVVLKLAKHIFYKQHLSWMSYEGPPFHGAYSSTEMTYYESQLDEIRLPGEPNIARQQLDLSNLPTPSTSQASAQHNYYTKTGASDTKRQEIETNRREACNSNRGSPHRIPTLQGLIVEQHIRLSDIFDQDLRTSRNDGYAKLMHGQYCTKAVAISLHHSSILIQWQTLWNTRHLGVAMPSIRNLARPAVQDVEVLQNGTPMES